MEKKRNKTRKIKLSRHYDTLYRHG